VDVVYPVFGADAVEDVVAVVGIILPIVDQSYMSSFLETSKWRYPDLSNKNMEPSKAIFSHFSVPSSSPP
jgi:hypothetical protein